MVVASPAAAEGISANPGTDFVIGDNAKKFASACLNLLENPNNQPRDSDLIFSTNLDSVYMIHIIQPGIQVSTRSPINDPGIIFYPNPAHDRFTINSRHLLIGDLEIFSMTGEKVFTIPLTSSFIDIIDVSLIPPGIYLVKVQTKESPVFKKLIIN